MLEMVPRSNRIKMLAVGRLEPDESATRVGRSHEAGRFVHGGRLEGDMGGLERAWLKLRRYVGPLQV